MKSNKLVYVLILIFMPILLTGCDGISLGLGSSNDPGRILASGVIEANQVAIAAQSNGRVAEIFVDEGSAVVAGDLMFILEDDLMQTQRSQAEAQLDSALAQLDSASAAKDAAQAYLLSAEISLASAEIHYQLVLSQIDYTGSNGRVSDWNENTPTQIEVPAWYFQDSEQIDAARNELERAEEFYLNELENFKDAVSDIDNQNFQSAEQRLVQAQAAFEVADALQDQQVGYQDREKIEDFVETIFEKAESELEAAQKAYDQILAQPDYEDILEARARVSVAKERFDLARDYLYQQYSGEYSLDVQAAETGIAQAHAGVQLAQTQILQADHNHLSAETAVKQAEAALDLIDLQLAKLQIYSPISGVILTRTIEPGEILSAGSTALMVGDLTNLTVTVYLPEDRYGQVSIGDMADLKIDSFPDRVFIAEVLRIADEAEYTPRNVQTQEERQNTVYAVELAVKNPDGFLKPGMPADVTFQK